VEADTLRALLAKGELKMADEAYVRYRRGHPNTPQTAVLVAEMADAHLQAGEYRLARFYVNEYRRDFPSGKERERIEYIVLESYDRPLKKRFHPDQADAYIQSAKAYTARYPHGAHRSEVQQRIRVLARQRDDYYRDLANYYQRRGKPKAAQIYRSRIRTGTPQDAGSTVSTQKRQPPR
jgi:outer membrane protein assembly factor BamD